PGTIDPGNRTNLLQWQPGRELSLKAGMEPDPQFWERIAGLTKIRVVQPELSIDISGRWNSPTGWVHASVLTASFSQTNRAIPSIENLRLDARLDTQQVRLDQL